MPAVPARGFTSVWSTKHGETHLRNCANQPLRVRRYFTEAEQLKKLDMKAAIAAAGEAGDVADSALQVIGGAILKRKARYVYLN